MIAHHSSYARIYRKHWIATMIAFCWIFAYGMQLPTFFGIWGIVSFYLYSLKNILQRLNDFIFINIVIFLVPRCFWLWQKSWYLFHSKRCEWAQQQNIIVCDSLCNSMPHYHWMLCAHFLGCTRVSLSLCSIIILFLVFSSFLNIFFLSLRLCSICSCVITLLNN